MRLILLALAAILASAPPSIAADAYPNMVGKWSGTAERVLSDPDGAISFRTDPITMEFTEQQGRRFVGRLLVADLNIQIIGVFLDERSFRWAESSGFADGHFTDPDTFEACYIRNAQFSKIAACEVLTRQE